MLSIIFYVVVFLLVVFIYKKSLILKSSNKKLSNILKLISFILLVLLVCFRFEVGTDFHSYMDFYELCGNIKISDIFNYRMEPGIILLYKLSNIFSSNPITIIFTLSLLILIALYSLLKLIEKTYDDKIDSSMSLATFLFLFLPFCFNGMRQGLALLLGLMAILYLRNNNTKKAILFSLFALMFHNSSIILLLYILLYTVFKKKNSFIKPALFTFIICMILYLSPTFLLGFSYFEKYSVYLNNMQSSINQSYIVLMILNLPLLFLIILNKKNIKDNDRSLCGLWISSQLLYFFCSFITYLNRLSLYFEIISIFILPLMLENSKSKKDRTMMNFITIIYLILYFIIHFYIFGSHDIFPYQNYLFQ